MLGNFDKEHHDQEQESLLKNWKIIELKGMELVKPVAKDKRLSIYTAWWFGTYIFP